MKDNYENCLDSLVFTSIYLVNMIEGEVSSFPTPPPSPTSGRSKLAKIIY
jgi:hypothetical protein